MADFRYLTAGEGALFIGICVASFWRGVKAGRLPCPVYPTPRAARWRSDELLAALEATRARPDEAVAARLAETRRQAKAKPASRTQSASTGPVMAGPACRVGSSSSRPATADAGDASSTH